MKIYLIFHVSLLELVLLNIFKTPDTEFEIDPEKKQNIEKIKDYKIYYSKLRYLVN